jgi:hypothetical protein
MAVLRLRKRRLCADVARLAETAGRRDRRAIRGPWLSRSGGFCHSSAVLTCRRMVQCEFRRLSSRCACASRYPAVCGSRGTRRAVRGRRIDCCHCVALECPSVFADLAVIVPRGTVAGNAGWMDLLPCRRSRRIMYAAPGMEVRIAPPTNWARPRTNERVNSRRA